MKTKLLSFMALCLLPSVLSAQSESLSMDTVIRLENKRIELKDDGYRMKVKVFDLNGGEMEDEMIFEGHYRNGQSYENRHTRSIRIPIPSWNKGWDGHWAGFGMGFGSFADGSLHVNNIDGVALRAENSLEYNLNVLEYTFPISRYGWALVTGAGMRWNRYRLDTNQHFQEIDGVTQLVDAPEGITYRKSNLNTTSLTIPLLLEWQQRKNHDSGLFVSAGIVGVIKTISSSRVVYNDESGKKRKEKKDRGMNIRPVMMDFLFQAGYDWIGLYAKYSPMTLFEKDKGPDVHPVSLGLQIHF
ncbi:outer membrane beta-barrel protein [Parabacteroides sp. Marseille-P3160]|uniref:outer membrane beta-barrel protein n=1 Tax=Parabacteroides sp. Marseille-P3160 TaxID=1917887 RepID=UPI0009BAC110|nr:outer membrane beta-barrel protein [Parabacteroides sp. Marseille-P3160]